MQGERYPHSHMKNTFTNLFDKCLTVCDTSDCMVNIKANRIAIRLDKDLLKRLDAVAAYLNRTRSDTVRILLEKAIRRERERV